MLTQVSNGRRMCHTTTEGEVEVPTLNLHYLKYTNTFPITGHDIAIRQQQLNIHFLDAK